MTPARGWDQAPALGPPPEPPPLRITRRGLGRLVQLGATAGAFGVAAVSCGVRLESGGSATAADRAVPGSGLSERGSGAAGSGTSGSGTSGSGAAGSGTAPGATGATRVGGSGPRPSEPARPSAVAAGLPGIGPSWAARLAGHDQVVLVSAADSAATRNVVRWFDRTAGAGASTAGTSTTGTDSTTSTDSTTGTDSTPGSASTGSWALRSTVSGWNGAGGWTTDHTVGDGRSPVGVFGLTDAGGFAPNPGTSLPYQYSTAEYSEIVNGVRTFEHVLAIDYNRVVGTPPSNDVRPQGWDRGGSIWVHVQHDSPTQACVGIPDAALVALLRWLRPNARPVILMGPAAILAT